MNKTVFNKYDGRDPALWEMDTKEGACATCCGFGDNEDTGEDCPDCNGTGNALNPLA